MNYLNEIYGADPTAQRYSNYLACFCPYTEQHAGSVVRRSLMVYEDFFICYSCGEQGHPKKLLNKLDQGIIIIPREVQEARQFKNPWTNWLRDKSLYNILKEGYQTLKQFPDLRYYLRNRGIPDAEILKLKLGYKENHFLFPIISKERRIIGSVARASDSIETTSKYVTPNKSVQNNADLLYIPSWKRVEASERVYIAFGIISALAVYLCGVAAGSTLTGKKARVSLFDDIRKPIVIVPDKHEEKEAYQLANRLGWRGNVLLLPYHDNILDPADMLKYEKSTLERMLQ